MGGAFIRRGDADSRVPIWLGAVQSSGASGYLPSAAHRGPGIFGDEYQPKTLWDEYCHEAQFGPHNPLVSAWNDTLRPFLERLGVRLA